MTFAKILKSLYSAYKVDACFIADHLKIPDDVVLAWEKGNSFPNDQQRKDLSAMFAVPLSVLEKSCEVKK
jgi:hypothetical protein